MIDCLLSLHRPYDSAVVPRVERFARNQPGQLAQIATELRRLNDSGVLEQVAAAARQFEADRAQFAQIALEVRRRQESGALDQVLKYQQQLVEVVETIRRITGP